MAQSEKLQTIDQKIKDLQDKKKQLEIKQIHELGKLLKKVEADTLPLEMLTGALLEIVEIFKDRTEKTQQWIKRGQVFLKLNTTPNKKNLKEGEKDDSSSFLRSKDQAERTS